MTERVELLSPAGNLEKLRFAVDYGADAVYCAPERFGMRAAAGNFTPEALAEGADYAQRRGAKLYVTLNTMPRDSELALLPSCVAALRDAGADAFIVADAGVAEVVRSVYPQAVLHLSTQASVVNAAACRFWYRQGFRRIVLARELTLEEIYFIRRNTPAELELEVFVHGAMCVAYSGRCLLSSYYTSRSANEGRCTQPCRWKYRVAEEKRPEDILRAKQDESGSYLFSSRDLCMIEHLGDLADAGVDAFKIEGRMKSAYYAAAVTNAYRLAYENARAGRPFDPLHRREVESVSHREYGTGFYYEPPSQNANICRTNEYIRDRAFLCTVTGYDERTRLARCVQRNKLCRGDRAQLLTPGAVGRDIATDELFDETGAPIEATPHPGQVFYLRCPGAKENDIIRAI